MPIVFEYIDELYLVQALYIKNNNTNKSIIKDINIFIKAYCEFCDITIYDDYEYMDSILTPADITLFIGQFQKHYFTIFLNNLLNDINITLKKKTKKLLIQNMFDGVGTCFEMEFRKRYPNVEVPPDFF